MKLFFRKVNKFNGGFTRTPKFGVTPKGGGFTLVETLVAISIFTMSLLGLMSIMASGISDTTYAKKKMAATYLAQEGIEYVRNMRDTAVLYSGNPQNSWSSFSLSTIPQPSDASFSRSVVMKMPTSPFTTITSPGALNEVKITSDVSWTQGSGTYHITFSEDLFNWIE